MADSNEKLTNHEDATPILNQSRVEHEMLANAKDGLIAALEWQTAGDTFTRKLSTLRFAAKNYQSHLERSMAIEEHDGYMDFVVEDAPQYSDKVAALRKEHDDFREGMAEIVTKLDRLMPTDEVGLQTIRQDVLELFRKYADHNNREVTLLQEAIQTDIGTGD